jgi:phosphinothricin acetyltransferase
VIVLLEDATEADLPAILAIFNDVIATSTAIYRDDPLTLEDRAAWLAARRADGFPVLVARHGDGAVFGVGSYSWFKASPPGYATTVEHTVMVSPAARGAGIGTALLEALIARATADGFHVMVASIDAENVGSLRLHERLRFAEVGRMPEVARKFGRWVDLVLLQRMLSSSNSAKSRLLTTTEPTQFSPALGYFADGASAAAEAAKVLEQIPLPGAKGRAVDTDWSAQVRSGGISRGDVEALLQFRAACDWIEAALSREELDAETAAVLRDLPDWSAIRGSEVSQRLGAAIEAYLVGDDGPLTEWAATNCVERGGR